MAVHEDLDGGAVDAEAARAHADAAGLRVDAENVLYVRRAILEEYETLKADLRSVLVDTSGYGHKYGMDPVSVDAAVAFPERARVLFGQCATHVEALLDKANNLEAAARAYGRTDADIAALTPKMNSISASAWLAESNASIGAVLDPRRWA